MDMQLNRFTFSGMKKEIGLVIFFFSIILSSCTTSINLIDLNKVNKDSNFIIYSNKLPDKPYDEIVVISAYSDGISEEKLIEKLKRKAISLGGDGLISTQIRSASNSFSISATVIKYKK